VSRWLKSLKNIRDSEVSLWSDEAVTHYANIDILSSDFSRSEEGSTGKNIRKKALTISEGRRRDVQCGTDTVGAARYDPPGPAASFPDDIEVFKTGAEAARITHDLDGR
jgi:hypothetical protein